MEKYYLVEKVKDRFMIDAFNINVVKQKKGKLEMLSSKVIKPKQIGAKLDEKGKIYCTDNKYKIKEITKEKASKVLKDREINYSLWQNHMSNYEDKGSPHLSFGLGGG